MNKLQLAQATNTLAMTQGDIASVDATGYQALILLHIDKAYRDIQTFREKWYFRRASIPLMLGPLLDNIEGNGVFTKLRGIRFNKRYLKERSYEWWLTREHVTGKPTEYTLNPADNQIFFNPSDANYTVDIDYIRTPHQMVTNTDTPIIPIAFHEIIMYKALVYLGSSLGNDDLISQYGVEYGIILGQLMRNQLPPESVTTRSIA